MATKYEYYDTGADTQGGIASAAWKTQTFTPSTSHTVTTIRLLLYRILLPGTVTVAIRATDVNGKPTGSNLASGTIDGDSLTTDTGGIWYSISLGAGVALTAGTKYAIVVSAPSPQPAATVQWKADSSSPSYAGGSEGESADSGATWTMYTTWDFMFEEWAGTSTPPTVTTDLTTVVLPTTATGNGQITSIGTALITEHGHCWSTSANPTTADSKTTNGAGSLGTFTSAITGLVAGTTYHVRAYATNVNGTSYGDNLTFITPATNTPQLTTEVPTAFTTTTVTGNGTIASIGGSDVTEHGHCWSTSANPTTSGSKTTNGFGVVGAFTSAITGLSAGTVYYMRAYATNTAGTSYGNNVKMVAGVNSDIGSELAGVIAIKGERLVMLSASGRRYYIQGVEY